LAVPVVGLVLFAAGLAAWRFSHGLSSIPVVAVEPADRSPEADALVKDVLFKLGSLRAAKTDAVRLTAHDAVDARHSDFIFEAAGSNIALLSGSNRSILWSKDFEEQSTNKTALEQSMAYTAGQVLDCALQAKAPSQARLDEQTLKLFLNGCALFAERYRSDSASVVPIFSQVVASAPRLEAAWSKLLLAESQALRGQMMFYDRCAPGGLPEHIRAASKLNPQLPEIYVARAALLPITSFEERLALVDRAVNLDLDNADVRVIRSELLASFGRNTDAIEDAKRAVAINPLSPGFRSHLITTLTYGGQTAAAEEELRRAEQLWPGSPTIEDARFRLHSRYGDAKDALKMIRSPDFHQPYPVQDMEKYLVARIDPTPVKVESAIAAVRSADLAQGRKVAQLEQLLADFGRNDELYSILMSLPSDRLRFVSQSFYRPNFRRFRQNPRFMQLERRAGMISFWRKTGKWPDFCFEPDLPYDCKKEAAKLSA
jgi:tetratricopeptide (TPR) repeat protein